MKKCRVCPGRLTQRSTATPEEDVEPEVAKLTLSGYPNPFNPSTMVRFGLPEAGNVTLLVYDLMGREVVRLAKGYREAG